MNGLAENLDPTAGDRDQAHDGLDQGRFARAIRADDADQFPGRHFQIDSPEHRVSMIGDGQIVNFQRRSGGLVHRELVTPGERR